MVPGKTYFPNLDGLRFMAAALVVADHLEQSKGNMKLPHNGDLAHWSMLGHLGVLLFFVLSGFLITYLLLEEERKVGRIHYRAFQMRRVLRIWPLYFLLVILAVLVFPSIHLMAMPDQAQEAVRANWPEKLGLYALFLPSLVPAIAGVVPHAGHLWSIGTEEHFYLLWPLLFRLIRRFRILGVVGVIIGYAVLTRFLGSPYADFLPRRDLFFAYWSQFNIDSLAIGALFALLAFKKSKLLKWLLDIRLFLVALVAVAFLMANGTLNEYVSYRTYSAIFGLLILNFAINPKVGRPLEWAPLRYLGRISYGIYIYHLAAIVLVLNVLEPLGLAMDLVTYPLVFALAIGVAALSHRYFEAFFLKFRDRFRPGKPAQALV